MGKKPQIIVSATCGRISGVDIFSTHLVRGLREAGVDAHILLTSPDEVVPDPLLFPADVPLVRLPIKNPHNWRARWQMLIDYLEQRTPCLYLPNYDWLHSCISPRLSNQVGIVGIVHSDDPIHYEHVMRLGDYWNAIVAVSQTIAQETARVRPHLTGRLHLIPYGVEAPAIFPTRVKSPAALRVVYVGRLDQHQKRVHDLPRIAAAANALGVPFHLEIVGEGEQSVALRDVCAPLVAQNLVHFHGALPNQQVLDLLAQSDVFLLPSAFEGLPVSLLEAMGQGCVPLVSDVRSGVAEVIEHGVNGFREAPGDIEAFAERLAQLQRDDGLRHQLALNAHRTIGEGRHQNREMVARYLTLFAQVQRDIESGAFRRQAGPILPPPSFPRMRWTNSLPKPAKALGRWVKRLSADLASHQQKRA